VKIEKQIILVIGILFLLMFLSLQNVSGEDELIMDMSIICPSQVNESFSFFVTIKSNDISLPNVTVAFDGRTNRTDSLGIVGFSAPRVLPDKDNVYTIVAFKAGYNETSLDVTVANVPQICLMVSPANIVEKTSFVVTVHDDEGGLVDNVIITFNDDEYLSGSNETVELTTPSVNKSKVFVISVKKQGYIDNSILITVYPLLSPENIMGFFIVIVICIVIVFAVVVIMIMKYLRRKRINRW